MLGITKEVGSGRVLDFDCESRPLSFRGDRPTAEITAIGMSWVGEDEVEVWLLGQDSPQRMLARFVELYNQADLVTGHYIRGFDLSMINAGLIEYDLGILGPKLTSDTKSDLVKYRDISAKQEDLLEMLGIGAAKYHMSHDKWRKANRLTDEGLKETYERVASDVVGHKLMRAEMLKRGLLGPPVVWDSKSKGK
jgi:hypothetical protein